MHSLASPLRFLSWSVSHQTKPKMHTCTDMCFDKTTRTSVPKPGSTKKRRDRCDIRSERSDRPGTTSTLVMLSTDVTFLFCPVVHTSVYEFERCSFSINGEISDACQCVPVLIAFTIIVSDVSLCRRSFPSNKIVIE